MGDFIGRGFGYELWKNKCIYCKQEDFSLIYQGLLSNSWVYNNLVDHIKYRIDSGNQRDMFFVFSDN